MEGLNNAQPSAGSQNGTGQEQESMVAYGNMQSNNSGQIGGKDVAPTKEALYDIAEIMGGFTATASLASRAPFPANGCSNWAKTWPCSTRTP